jgi:2'-hydroxyisoflavone reductase
MQYHDDENAPVEELEDPTTENVSEAYGGLKVLCERVVEEIYADRALNVRPGMIVGPHDPTDRYTYWAIRIARGGEVLVPGLPENPVQMIDARDLGAWMLHLLEQEASGVFNATGPQQPITWAQWMAIFGEASGSSPRLTWLDEAFLTERQLDSSHLPFWFPAEYQNLFAVSVDKAVRAGLTFRNPVETARDTLAWKGAADLNVGLTPEREAELLAEWHQEKRE